MSKRFNLDHVRPLARHFSSKVDFLAVSQSQITNVGRHLAMPLVLDQDGSLGLTPGVYGMLQAVLLTSTGRLYFRGHYKSSLYYAVIAYERLLWGSRMAAPGHEAS